MLVITGTFRTASDASADLEEAMRAMIAASRAEDGCIAYSYARDVIDPALIHVHEVWRDRPSLDAHWQSDHLRRWRTDFDRLGITDRDLVLLTPVAPPEPV
jgi:quinol monooxygenase YgiN